jgi:hypothetical protein
MRWQVKAGWFHRLNILAVIRSTWWALHHTSKMVHRLLVLGLGILVVLTCLLAVATWRLAQGPIDLGFLSERIRVALADDSAALHVSFGGVFLAWEGFQKGVDYPLDVRLADIAITDQSGREVVTAPAAHLTFSLASLLLGRVIPRAIEVDHARASVTRDADGSIDLGETAGDGSSTEPGAIDLRQFREQLSRPVGSDHGRSRGLFDQIRRVHFRDTELTFLDRGSGLVVRTPSLNLDLVRAAGGRIRGLLTAPLMIGDQKTDLVTQAEWISESHCTIEMKLTPVRPAGIGHLPADLAFLGGLDVPMALALSATFDAGFSPGQFQAELQAGQGRILAGQGAIPLRSGTVTLSGTPDRIDVANGHFDVAHAPDSNPEIIDIGATVLRASNRLTASISLGLSQIDMADLPLLWPPDFGSGARSWINENITAGMITHGAGTFVIEADDGLRHVTLTRANADVDGVNGTFTWMNDMPPVEQAAVHLHLADPDMLDIFVPSGRQRIRSGSDLLVKDGQMHITGLSAMDQTTVIHVQTDGQIDSVLALLKEPRLHLLAEHPISLKVGGGDASTKLMFQFPLNSNIQIDDVQLHADAHLKRLRLLDIAGGHELTDGIFDLSVNKDGLSLKGQGALAAIPVVAEGTMDFTSGPPDQITQTIAVSGQPDAMQLDAAGLHFTDVLGGLVPLTAVVTERRNGEGAVALTADLTPASLSVSPLAWNKATASAANASANLLLSHGRLTKIDRIAVTGNGLLVNGSVNFTDGQPRSVVLDGVRLGRTQGRGTIRIAANNVITIVLQGEQIDLTSKLTEKTSAPDRTGLARPSSGSWGLNAHFDHAILANDIKASNLFIKGTGSGDQIRLLDVIGATSAGAGFSVKIEPSAGNRRLLVDAKDAGSFLKGVDAIRVMQAGHLTIDGAFSRPAGLYPLAGSMVVDDAVVQNSPVMGKLLQAITLYGLVDALRGPGMAFSRMVVPFQYDGVNLDIDQAYAENPSLGLTAKGRIDLSTGLASLTGTIVPAYFFNSVLGQLPLVGRFFSPEKGGGVFAVRFGVDGQIADPNISINPVSAFTPGFLREIFGVFDRGPNHSAAGKDGTASNGQ